MSFTCAKKKITSNRTSDFHSCCFICIQKPTISYGIILIIRILSSVESLVQYITCVDLQGSLVMCYGVVFNSHLSYVATQAPGVSGTGK
jgi:hypothetical protein